MDEQTPAETFVIALSRASKRGARYLRGLKTQDRDDVIATAVLDCWERREQYNPNVSLDDWFMEALKVARQAVKRGNRTTSVQLSAEMAGPDDVAASVEAEDAARALLKELTPREKRVITLRVNGLTTAEILQRVSNVEPADIYRLNCKLKELRNLIPDGHSIERLVRQRRDRDDVPAIDQDIERLDFAPQNEKDCIPCWKCMWWTGMTPAKYRPTKLADPELQEAVQRTEVRKILIATTGDS